MAKYDMENKNVTFLPFSNTSINIIIKLYYNIKIDIISIIEKGEIYEI